MALFGISGKMGSGKDTVGMLLQALTMPEDSRWRLEPLEYVQAYKDRPNLKGGFRIKKFGEKVKKIASILLGVPEERFESQEFKRSQLGPEWDNMTVREFLQKLGTDAGRNMIHPNIWVNALFADYVGKDTTVYLGGASHGTVIEHEPIFPNWLITDVRFPNEAEAIKKRGGILMRVERWDLLRLGYMDKNPHESETALDNYEFDIKITNDDSMEKLLDKCTFITETYFKPVIEKEKTCLKE